MTSRVLLLTPPFTQLNTPYPATAYLKGFLNTKKITSYQADLGIEVILSLFSSNGLKQMFQYLESLDGVTEVHDLHIWGMSTTETALSAHLAMPTGLPGDAFHKTVSDQLKEKFGIDHPTIQIELQDSGVSCKLAPAHVV